MRAPSTSSSFLAVTVSMLACSVQHYYVDGNMHCSFVHVHSKDIVERYCKVAAQQHIRHAATANCLVNCLTRVAMRCNTATLMDDKTL